MNIIIKPEKIWDYFKNNQKNLQESMVLVAESDEYDVSIYLTGEKNTPYLIIESSNIESVEYPIKKEECASVVKKIYDLYLTEQIVTVIMGESDSDDVTVVEEREEDIDGFILRLLEDLFDDNPLIYSDLIDDVVEDCKEHFLEYLYRKHGLSVYRPMELEDDEGVFTEDYPYECMVFEPNPLYDKENK